MKKKTTLLLAFTAVALAGPAHAETAQQQKMKTCNTEATQKSLKGDERKTFMSQCLSSKTETESATLTPQQAKMKRCNVDATRQGLKGTTRKTFMSQCLAK